MIRVSFPNPKSFLNFAAISKRIRLESNRETDIFTANYCISSRQLGHAGEWQLFSKKVVDLFGSSK